jgi:hypothetical protein
MKQFGLQKDPQLVFPSCRTLIKGIPLYGETHIWTICFALYQCCNFYHNNIWPLNGQRCTWYFCPCD